MKKSEKDGSNMKATPILGVCIRDSNFDKAFLRRMRQTN